jgi:NAD-dependent SIR2 family protein deacetylase
MRTKRIIITGAGFSAPAKLPIQNQIIYKMIEKPESNFWDDTIPQESLRFINAYIKVGLFLLDNYAKADYSNLKVEFNHLKARITESQIISSLLERFAKNKTEVGSEALKQINELILNDDMYYKDISILREQIRRALSEESIDVDLEDVFTSFDKTMQMRENIHQYSYNQMDEIRHSITRLFVYYFSKCISDHNYNQEDYLNFISYLKRQGNKIQTSIITTNWDTLLEGYLDISGTDYNLSFLPEYFLFDNTSTLKRNSDRKVKLIKLHGSINWLRCMNCNTLSIFEKDNAAKFLFQDDVQEKCKKCQSNADIGSILLQPEIITPTMIKSINSQLYHNLWSAAGNELMGATHVIFIGYSLPIADYEFRYLLQKNVPQNVKIDVVLYGNDDPSQIDNSYLKTLLPEKRYLDLFPKNPISFHYEGFGKYFELDGDNQAAQGVNQH